MFGQGFWEIGRLSDTMSEIQRLQRGMNRLFSFVTEPYGNEFPSLNAWIGESDIIVTAELPGIDPANIEISVTGDILKLNGVRENELLKAGENYHRQERSHGKFSRTLQLPFTIKTDDVQAKYEKGILKITLPRAGVEKPKRIKIKGA
jgi:HSP20 family protein